MGFWLVFALAAATAGASPVTDGPVKLRCDGLAAGTKTRVNYLANGRTSSSATNTEYRERLLFELVGGVARVHLPKSLVPPLNSGSDDSWWPVSDLRVTDDAIEGRFRLNILNKPSFRIDRINGDIDLKSAIGEGFRGQCESNLGAERKF